MLVNKFILVLFTKIGIKHSLEHITLDEKKLNYFSYCIGIWKNKLVTSETIFLSKSVYVM